MRFVSVLRGVLLPLAAGSLAVGVLGVSGLFAQTPADVQTFMLDVRNGDIAAVEMALESAPTLVAFRDDEGATPLHLAGSPEVAGALIDAGASVSAVDASYNATPLRWAAEDDRIDVARLLIAKGAEPADIFIATAMGDTARISQLLAEDPKLANARTPQNDVMLGETPGNALHVAGYHGQAAAAKLLLDAGADVHDRGGWGNTEPIEKAAFAGHADVIRVLAAAGADLEHVDAGEGKTSLHYAVVFAHPDAVQALLDAGAKVHPDMIVAARTKLEQTPPDQTDVRDGLAKVIELLQTPAAK